MKSHLLALITTALCGESVWSQLPDDPSGSALLQQAQRSITAYHAGQPKSGAVLRVVYFHPNDRDPLPDYAGRLDRVLNDVSDFYRDGLRRFGIANDGLPLERKDGRLVLHVVQGKLVASAYNYASGDETAKEIRAALKPVLDLDREHVLVIYGLCRKEPDGRYVFDAPYYGGGNQRGGLCHAADCELLDPRLLTETGKPMVFTEHYYARVEKSVAGFNTMYLGGLAHELGHGLGLFHDSAAQDETTLGTSLMGMGNLHYRNEISGGKSPAFLARVSALHLASHPFFSGSNRGRWDEIDGGIKAPTFISEPDVLRIQGKAAGAIAPYAVVAYVWETRATDHSSRTFPIALADGSFELVLTGLRPALYFMRLTSLHVNGGATWEDYHFGFDAAGKPETPQQFNWPWPVVQAEKALLKNELRSRALLSDESIARASEADQRLLRVLRGTLDPAEPADLAAISSETAWLSDARWTEATVGWGKVARNHGMFDSKQHQSLFLMLGGQIFEKGLYAHSPSRYAFDLGGRWKTFTATVGVRDGAGDAGSAFFRVIGDGKELHRTPSLNVGARATVNLSVVGVKNLELITESGQSHNHGSWAIWAEPAVRR